jgi:hypothetical protein
MPIFGRRQLQRMLDELGPWLDCGKAKDLLNRLENEKPNQALPAEYELSISWAVSKIATLEIDRPSGTRTPDIYSPDLLPSGPIIADVAALDDFSLSGDRLSSFGHDIEKSFGLPPEEAEREAMDALDTFDRLATLITERHESLLSEAADAAKDALADELFGQVQSELDILSTHSTVEGVHLESLTIASLDSQQILFEGDGSVDVRLQYGSDADVERDDGAVSYDKWRPTPPSGGLLKHVRRIRFEG